jgi:hypothetical protein
MKRCVLFLGRRPGGHILGHVDLHWTEAKKYNWDHPLLTKMKNGRWACIVPMEKKKGITQLTPLEK